MNELSSKSKRMKQGVNINSRNKMGPVTVETVRRIVAQEGRSARNLISWNAPLDVNEKPKPAKSSKTPVKRRSKSYDVGTSEKQKTADAKTAAPMSSAKRQVSIRARYWAYLFDNLRRAVDEIYATCETDRSVVECKEVLLVLDNYRHDFQALIDWIHLEERLNSTDIANRPTSLAWEVRKSSPGRPRQRLPSRSMNSIGMGIPEPSQAAVNGLSSTSGQPSSTIKRCLKFNDESSGGFALAMENHTNQSVPARASCESHCNQPIRSNSDKKPSISNTNVTWADRVKGFQRSPHSQNKKAVNHSQNKAVVDTVDKETPEPNDVDDGGGWEKVSSRSKQAKKLTKESATNIVSVKTVKPIGGIESPIRTPSVGEPFKSTPLVKRDKKTQNYSGIVVERVMGTSSSASYSSKIETPLGARLFEINGGTEEDISLESLDDVEAQFFKNGNVMVSEDEESSVLGSMDSDSKANLALREHDASIAAAEQEEQQLMKEIEAEENTPCDTDPETTNDTETPTTPSASTTPRDNSDWSSIMARFEMEQELHRGISWGELIEEEELREPGRAVQMHEKLSSPSRRRTPAESKRKMEEKQRLATLRRQKMVQDKTDRIHILSVRVADVRRLKDDLIGGRTELIKELHMEKLTRAEQQRATKLMKIKQKAQAEETKVNEILFINELQEQNKRHDVLNRILEHDARLQELQQERSKMFEVKAAKEENVKERRRLLEKERQDRLSELINKRRGHDSRIEQLKQEREKEREKQAREKERDRKTRLSALNAAQQEAVEELQKKIQIKHDESERRHQEQLEQRKEKALELSLGRFSLSSSGNMQPGEMQNAICEGDKTKHADSVNPQIDLSSLQKEDKTDSGKGDAIIATKSASSDNTIISPRNISSVDENKAAKEKEARMLERKKAMRKRAKKLRTRMEARGREFVKAFDEKSTAASSSKNKVARLVKDISRKLASQKDASGPWPKNRVSALDRILNELNRLLEKRDPDIKNSFRTCGGFETLEQILELPLNSILSHKGEVVSILPDRTIANVAATLKTACENSYDNVLYMLYTCRFVVLIDMLAHQLAKCVPEESASLTNSKSPIVGRKSGNAGGHSKSAADPESIFTPAASALLDCIAFSLGYLASHPPVQEDGSILIRDNKQLIKAIAVACTGLQKVLSNDLDPRKISESFLNRGLDVVSYVVSTGVLDKLSVYLNSVRSEIEANGNVAVFIKHGLLFLNAVTEFVALRNRTIVENADCRARRTSVSSNASAASNEKPNPEKTTTASLSSSDLQTWDGDPTQLLPTLSHTEIMGVVSVLYGILLHGAPERPILLRNNSAGLDDVAGSEPPREIPAHVLDIAMSVMVVLNAVAELDIYLLQECLGAEGVSLEFRHICTYLLWYCQHGDRDGLLHEVIVCVGHFAVLNKKNQELVHSGAMPTVLQQLCVLPFCYFSNPNLSHILFPTLIACCHDNTTNLAMLEQEASGTLLSSYIKGILDEMGSRADAGMTSQEHRSESFAGSKRRICGGLSSNRLYTVSFLKDAIIFFRES